jgi:hypothetical protein
MRAIVALVFLLPFCFTTPAYAERIAPELAELLAGYKPSGASAEVLLRHTQIQVNADTSAESRAYVAVYLQAEDAVRDYSQMSISFNSFYETLELEFARVQTRDGKRYEIEKDAVQVQNPAEENFYQDTKDLTFSLPNLQPGAVIEFQYKRREIKKIIPGAWFESFWMNWWEERAAGQGQRLDPVLQARFEVFAPPSLKLHAHASSAVTAKPARKTLAGQDYWLWEQKNLPEVILQNGMPRDLDKFPVVQISSLASWQAVSRWADALIAPHSQADEKIKTLALQLGPVGTSPEQKIKNLYQFMQEKVRYVFAHVGRGGYEPHSANAVLANGYGDCKDQTVLAVTLLRQMGLEAYPALVSTRARGLSQLDSVSVAFDHMIVHIPAQQKMPALWMDTTGESSLFPGFSTGIEGQPALIISPNTQSLSKIPDRTAPQHAARMSIRFEPPTGSKVVAHFNLQLQGVFEESLRATWLYAPEKQKALTDMLSNLYAAGELTGLKTENAENPWAPFEVTGQFVFNNAWPGANKPMSYGFSLEQLLMVFTDLSRLHKPQERKQDYANEPPFQLIADVEFPAPVGDYRSAIQTRGGNYQNPWFSVTQQAKEEARRVNVHVQFTANDRRISLLEYPKFYAAAQNLLDAPGWQVHFLPATKSSTTNKAASDVGGLVAQARQALDSGDFAQALRLAQNAVAAAPKNGEAYYVLGLAQGYQEQVDAANQSFSRARELGYNP